MKTNIEHSIRVVTELWHQLEKGRTDNNSGGTSQAQRMLLQAAYEKYDLIDKSDPLDGKKRKGIRVPVLVEATKLIGELTEEGDA